MRDEAVQDVVRVLPDGFGDDEGRAWVDFCKNGHAFFLRADEAVTELGFVGVGADEFVAERGDCFGELFFHRRLERPGDLVSGLAQVAVGDEEDGFGGAVFHEGVVDSSIWRGA